MSALLLFIGLCSPAFAASPRPAAPSGAEASAAAEAPASALEYLNTVNALTLRAVRGVNGVMEARATVDSLAAFETFRLQVTEEIKGLRANLAALPPWEGDQTVQPQLLKAYDLEIALLEGPLASFGGMVYRSEIHSADMEQLEALWAAIVSGEAAAASLVESALVGFGERHHIKVTMLDTLPDEPDFTCPGLPPKGSHLSPRLHAVMAIHYHNGMLRHHEATQTVAAAMFRIVKGGTLEELDAQIAQIDATLAAVDKAGPWLGDAGLQVAFAAGLHTWREIAEEDIRPMLTLKAEGLRSQKQVDTFNAHVAHVNQRASTTYPATKAALDEFQRRWGILALQDWDQSHPSGGAATTPGEAPPSPGPERKQTGPAP